MFKKNYIFKLGPFHVCCGVPNQIKFNQANSCNTRPPSGLQNQICIQNALKNVTFKCLKSFPHGCIIDGKLVVLKYSMQSIENRLLTKAPCCEGEENLTVLANSENISGLDATENEMVEQTSIGK